MSKIGVEKNHQNEDKSGFSGHPTQQNKNLQKARLSKIKRRDI